MSHFVRCDRCATEDSVMGTISLPPGWQKICGADLCEPCCMMVHDFIRFKPSDAEKLPIEPIPAELKATQAGPISDKLFETESQVSADSHPVSDTPAMGSRTQESATDGDPEGKTQPASAEFNPAIESNAEERARTRKSRKLRAEIGLPDQRKPTDPPPGVQP
jgi:hypothetical protein